MAKRKPKNLLDILMDENNTDPITLTGKDGSEFVFEQVAVIPHGKKLYVILKPAAKMRGFGEKDALVCSVEGTGDDASLEIELDDDIALGVFEKYYDMLEYDYRNKGMLPPLPEVQTVRPARAEDDGRLSGLYGQKTAAFSAERKNELVLLLHTKPTDRLDIESAGNGGEGRVKTDDENARHVSRAAALEARRQALLKLYAAGDGAAFPAGSADTDGVSISEYQDSLPFGGDSVDGVSLELYDFEEEAEPTGDFDESDATGLYTIRAEERDGKGKINFENLYRYFKAEEEENTFVRSLTVDGRAEEEDEPTDIHELIEQHPNFLEMLKFLITCGEASTARLQRKFSLGFNRAARIIDEMERHKFISPPEPVRRRVLITIEQFMEKFGDIFTPDAEEMSIKDLFACAVRPRETNDDDYVIVHPVRFKDGTPITVHLRKRDGRYVFVDNQCVLRYMHKNYELLAEDVQYCITEVLNYYGIRIIGTNLAVFVHEKSKLVKTFFDFLNCITQLANMNIFFDSPG